MKIKTSKLIGAQLDWAVAKCEGYEVDLSQNWYEATTCSIKASYAGGASLRWVNGGSYSPPADWAQGGPIIERVGILNGPSPFPQGECAAGIGNEWSDCESISFGLTPLIAAMRCYVASKLGDEIEIPDELL